MERRKTKKVTESAKKAAPKKVVKRAPRRRVEPAVEEFKPVGLLAFIKGIFGLGK